MSNVRYRLTFGKRRELRFTGHLDLHRAWERTFRRAELSLAYSEGFNPRPKINIGAALPLGCTSEADLVDIELTETLDPELLINRLSEAAPPGLTISSSETIETESPKLQKLIISALYSVQITDQDPELLEKGIKALLTAPELPRQRRGKEYDLRPLIEDLTLSSSGELSLQLTARSNATGRPDEVLHALEIDPEPLVPHRVRLILREPS
jgi:radical SAM-linked protein